MDTSPEVNQHPAALTDLRFKQNKMRSKVTSPRGDPENLQAESSRTLARGHHALTHKENVAPKMAKTKDASVFTP